MFKKDGLELDGNVLSLFNSKGFVDGKSWIMNVFLGAFVEVEPMLASPEIINIINDDIENGDFEKIDHIIVGSNVGLRLFLEGKISNADIRKAETDNKTITFRSIKFHRTSKGKISFDVVVVKDLEFDYATVDVAGNVI